MKSRTTDLRLLLMALSVAIVVVTMVSYLNHLSRLSSPQSLIYDETFVSVIKQISNSISQQETLVVSTNPTHLEYFTEHTVKVPYGVASEQQLYEYMKKSNFHYLIVFENRSAEPALNSLFSSKGLVQLDKHFEKVETFNSEFSIIHLFKMKTEGIAA